jgi:hypothetical protein
MDPDIVLEQFQIKWTRTINMEQAVIYNYTTDTWEDLKATVYDKKANQYMDERGEIHVQFKIKQQDKEDYRMEYPDLRMKGVKK